MRCAGMNKSVKSGQSVFRKRWFVDKIMGIIHIYFSHSNTPHKAFFICVFRAFCVKNEAPPLKKWPCDVKKWGVNHENWGIFEIALWHALLGFNSYKVLWIKKKSN